MSLVVAVIAAAAAAARVVYYTLFLGANTVSRDL